MWGYLLIDIKCWDQATKPQPSGASVITPSLLSSPRDDNVSLSRNSAVTLLIITTDCHQVCSLVSPSLPQQQSSEVEAEMTSLKLLTWLTALIETAAVPLCSSAPDWNQLLVRVSAARCGDDADDGGLVLTQNIFLLCWSTNIFFLTSTILTLEHSSKDLIHPIRQKN